MKESRVAEANKIKVDEYEVKTNKAGHMIMNKDTTEHTCNACKKTLRQI